MQKQKRLLSTDVLRQRVYQGYMKVSFTYIWLCWN